MSRLSDVPVPAVRWIESDGELLGNPFFLMDLVEASFRRRPCPTPSAATGSPTPPPAISAHYKKATIAVLADLHEIPDAATTFGFLTESDPG